VNRDFVVWHGRNFHSEVTPSISVSVVASDSEKTGSMVSPSGSRRILGP